MVRWPAHPLSSPRNACRLPDIAPQQSQKSQGKSKAIEVGLSADYLSLASVDQAGRIACVLPSIIGDSRKHTFLLLMGDLEN